MINSIKQIPKAEIHVHLEATISPDLCRKFAKKNNVIIEPQDISRIIGLVDNIIKKEKD